MIYMIGNAHIDPVWFWQWTEGYAEVKATFQSALDRIGETDDFVFTAACADYYRWVEENNPEMFEKIKDAVKADRWHIVGGMWIQPDCNMPSGESFARQLMYSQRYFYEKFGITVKTGYNVDSFGHSYMLPQLLKKAGIDNYVFQRPGAHENSKIPFPLFKWCSPDGSCINTFRLEDGYAGSYGDVSDRIDCAKELEKEKGYPMMAFYGVGNHGGGPTIKNIKSICKYREENTDEPIVFSDPDTYFEEIQKLNLDLPVWDNELQHHASGCYSATSLIKRLNRQTENSLTSAEGFACLSNRLTRHAPDHMTQGWHNLMFNQFHDILCGCSIREAYDNAAIQLNESRSIAMREQNRALQKISWAVDTKGNIPERLRSKESHFSLWEKDNLGTPVVVFNPNSFECEGTVQVFGKIKYATDENDNDLSVQIVRASRTNGDDKFDSIFRVKVPSLGYRLYWVYLDEKNDVLNSKNNVPIKTDLVDTDDSTLENSFLCVRFSPDGNISSIYDKKAKREFLSGDTKTKFFDISHADTWAHMIFKFDKYVSSFGDATFEKTESGEIRNTVRVTTHGLNSIMTTDYTLYAFDDKIDVHVKLDCEDKWKMVKLCLPVNVTNPKSVAEISYGSIERECNGDEENGHGYMGIFGDEGGLAVLNDGKYSFSCVDNEMQITLANTSVYADHYGQNTRDSLCVNADIGVQEFNLQIVVFNGKYQNATLSHRSQMLNRPLVSVTETYHDGCLPTKYCGMKLDKDNITVGAVKRAEDDNGFIIRAVETFGTATTVNIDAKMFDRKVKLSFSPFEIKTIFIPDNKDDDIKELLLTEM